MHFRFPSLEWTLVCALVRGNVVMNDPWCADECRLWGRVSAQWTEVTNIISIGFVSEEVSNSFMEYREERIKVERR